MYLKIHVWLDVNITLCTRPMPKHQSVPKPCRWLFNSPISNESMEFYTQRTVDMACSFPKRSAAYLHDLHPTDIIQFHIINVLCSLCRLSVSLKIWEIFKTNREKACMPWHPVIDASCYLLTLKFFGVLLNGIQIKGIQNGSPFLPKSKKDNNCHFISHNLALFLFIVTLYLNWKFVSQFWLYS